MSTNKLLFSLGALAAITLAALAIHNSNSRSTGPSHQNLDNPIGQANSSTGDLPEENSQPLENGVAPSSAVIDPAQERVEQLLRAADLGTYESLSEARVLASKCESLEGNAEEVLELSREDGMPEFYLDHIERDVSLCNELQIQTGESFGELVASYESSLSASDDIAQKADDLVRVLHEGGVEAADPIAIEALESRNGYAYMHLGSYFMFTDQLFPPKNPQQARMRLARDNALVILSCKYGLKECKRGSDLMIVQCGMIKSESCYRSMNLVQYHETFEWSPAEQTDAYEMASEIERLVDEGEARRVIELGRNGS